MPAAIASPQEQHRDMSDVIPCSALDL